MLDSEVLGCKAGVWEEDGVLSCGVPGAVSVEEVEGEGGREGGRLEAAVSAAVVIIAE